MDVLLLRLEAPLMSFGAVMIDKRGVIQRYPALSAVCGLLANALGFHHRDTDALERLQQRLRYACREDRRGERLRDYQTADLGQDFLDDSRAWTTRGKLEERGKSKNSKGTTIRLRDYWADGASTLALALEPPGEPPTLDDLERALEKPERPLFIGRKCCLPASRLLLGRGEAEDLLDALRRAPLAEGVREEGRFAAWWPVSPGARVEGAFTRPVTDGRDWANQIHVGERWIAAGRITVNSQEVSDD